jgi:hypothetical protein
LNIMTTQRFRPIFNAVITPASVSTRTDKNGAKYAYLAGATVAREGREDATLTVMAFGKSRDAVAKLLRKGKAVEFAVQPDGGTLRIIGLPRAAAA